MDAQTAAFVEKAGVVLETTGLTRLAGRLLGWLLICSPEAQSAEDLVTALRASTGGISTQARALIRYGFVERIGIAGDRRTYYRLKDHAFEAAFVEQAQAMGMVRALADEGLELLQASPGRSAAGQDLDRLRQMRDLFAFMEGEWPELMRRFHAQQQTNARG